VRCETVIFYFVSLLLLYFETFIGYNKACKTVTWAWCSKEMEIGTILGAKYFISGT